MMDAATTEKIVAAPAANLHPATPQLFRDISSRLASSVAVITTTDPDGAGCGLTMTAVVPLSLSPMQYIVCLGHGSRTLAAIREHGRFCINVLSQAQREISNTFASKAASKFEGVDHHRTDCGVPIIAGAAANILCDVAGVIRTGDHDIVIGEVTHGTLSEHNPLLYFAKGYAGIG